MPNFDGPDSPKNQPAKVAQESPRAAEAILGTEVPMRTARVDLPSPVPTVRREIDLYSADADKEVLRWLFERYHMASQWGFVARCDHQRYGKLSYETHRVWRPTEEGRALFANYTDLPRYREALEFYADPENWKQVETGIGMYDGDTVDYGSRARTVLSIPHPE